MTCHAPSCGKLFYSARADARACPKRNRLEDRSACKLEWDRYCRRLKDLRRNIEDDWADEELQADFREYDREWQERKRFREHGPPIK